MKDSCERFSSIGTRRKLIYCFFDLLIDLDGGSDPVLKVRDGFGEVLSDVGLLPVVSVLHRSRHRAASRFQRKEHVPWRPHACNGDELRSEFE